MKDLLRYSVVAFSLFASLLRGAEVQTGGIRINNEALGYLVSADSLRSVHFRNLKYRFNDDWIQLHNGDYGERQDFGGTETKIERVWFFDPMNGVPQHVLVWITQTECGASCGVVGDALLFEIRDAKLVRVQQFDFPAKENGAGVQLDPAHGRLIVTAGAQNAFYLDELTCIWKDGRFEPTAFRRRLP